MGATAQHKLEALGFWEKHGINATLDFFKISRTTLYRWPKIYREQGLSALNDQSRTPHHRRRRNWSPKITAEIRRLRQVYPNLGDKKLYCKLSIWCAERALPCPKPRTIARLIADAPDRMHCSPQPMKRVCRTKTSKRRLRKEKERALYPGYQIAIDTIHYFVNRIRYYLFTDPLRLVSFLQSGRGAYATAISARILALLQATDVVEFPNLSHILWQQTRISDIRN